MVFDYVAKTFHPVNYKLMGDTIHLIIHLLQTYHKWFLAFRTHKMLHRDEGEEGGGGV